MQDDAVRKALAAELAERARQAVAAKAAAASSTTAAPTTSAANRKGAVSTVPGDLGASDGDVNAQDTNGSIPLGGDVGGQTGKGGVGSRPAGADATDFGSPTWVCPVQGPVAFADTWGAPRSGGRVHQGVDMIGERGLPVVAVVDGFAQQNVNELGGNTVLFTGTDGNKYYYAHLDSWANLGQVTAGTVIGYLGQTGNAQFSVPHLHFEIHPGGGEPADPYPTVRAHCV
jgi:murein DD-endopeptidase MepM/ murein hydrolase activator NlpD